jgi:D-3-phosphoglycerate dehydrogenase
MMEDIHRELHAHLGDDCAFPSDDYCTMKIAITTSSFAKQDPRPLELLRREPLEILLNPHGRTLKAGEVADLLQGCTGVIAGTEALGADVLAAFPDLRVISRCGVGLDGVDLAYAARHGIAVRNTPDAPTLAVVELTLGLILDLCRRISAQDRDVRNGVWKKRMGSLLAGKKMGLVGFGRIGRRMAGLASALGCEVAFHDPQVLRPEAFPSMALEDLLRWCDCLSLHCPGSEDGKPLLNAERLSLLPKGALLINAARGGLVDEEALHGALVEGRLGGAALDVFAAEPYSGPLAGLDNVVLTPHVGSYAREARAAMEMEAVANLLEELGRLGLL